MSKIACHSCGAPLPPQTRFCPSCGTALRAVPSVSQPASPPLPKPAAQPARRVRPRGCLIALLVFVLSGTLLIMLLVSATTVNIHDDAHILDARSIQTAEQDLTNYHIDIYTVSNFASNDPNALLHDANTHQQNQDTVIEIDPLHRQIAVDDPSSDSLSNDAYKAFVCELTSLNTLPWWQRMTSWLVTHILASDQHLEHLKVVVTSRFRELKIEPLATAASNG